MMFREIGSTACVSAALLAFSTLASAGVISGTFQSDGDLAQFNITFSTPGTISLQSLGYGGWTPLLVSAGGFATSLSLYDNAGNQIAHDFLGGTAVGAGCSDGTQQAPITGLCEDAFISGFALPAGFYSATLSEQGNDGPDPLSTGFALNPGQNFSPGPFVDPGLPGIVTRSANWALLITTTGTATVTQLPEPSGLLFVGAGVAGLAIRRRFRRK
jgi:hypothetical protein